MPAAVPRGKVEELEEHGKEAGIMKKTQHGHRWTCAAFAALLLAALAAPAAAPARQDPGGPPVESTQQVFPQCPLQRIGQQLVRCDSLTGAGVPAPSWVPEQ